MNLKFLGSPLKARKPRVLKAYTLTRRDSLGIELYVKRLGRFSGTVYLSPFIQDATYMTDLESVKRLARKNECNVRVVYIQTGGEIKIHGGD